MALTAKKVYAILKRQISDMEAKLNSPVRYRGTVATADLLPLNPDIGDMYNIESKSVYGEAGMNVAWNGVVWDTMGAPIDMSLYIKSSELADWVKQQNKPTYTANEVGALPADTKIPSKTSELKNDSGFLTKVPDSYLNGTDTTLKESGKAADAKVTGDKFSKTSVDLEKKLDKNQGSENSGKIAGINESGDIVPMFPVGVEYNEETNCLEFGSDQGMKLNQGIGLDSSLTKTGYAADAGVVGEVTNSLKEDLDNVENAVFVESNKKNIEWVTGFVNAGGNFNTSKYDKILKPVPLYKGETVRVKTKGDGSYFFDVISKVDSENISIEKGEAGGTQLVVLANNNLTEYTYTAMEDIIIVVCVLNDATSVVTFENIKKVNRIDTLEDNVKTLSNSNVGPLKNKSVMYFGDSLTSASGVVGFAEIIANNYTMPIRSFIYDSADGNSKDVPVEYKCVTNYAKDGTMNRVIPSRTDSVLERVKRHITSDTDVDYVLIECCVNDMASSNRNKGSISESYTEEYDISTTIGAIEETIRYITTLGKNIKVGAFIPWLISWNAQGWFDDYIAVFEKWGIPVFDMRKCSGFNLYKCSRHRLLYTLSSDSYETYNSTKTYNLDDKVKYQGTLYKCLVNGVVGVLPTDTTKWMSVSSETADGTHLNNIGHQIVSGKIMSFLESL